MSSRMHQREDNKAIPMTSVSSGKGGELRPDVYYFTNQIVNLIKAGTPCKGGWVLADNNRN